MSSALRLSIAEYDQMVERGAFHGLNRNVELILGEIYAMNPAGPIHDSIIEYLIFWSTQNVDPKQVRVRIQSGLRIAQFDSRPEPDVMWIRKGDFRRSHPSPENVLLLIEVADSSLDADRNVKAQLYAKAGVPEYWIVNAQDMSVHAFHCPSPNGYQSLQTYFVGDTLAPQSFPTCVLDLREMFVDG